ncbi:MAG: glycosyltransferase family 4 protein [Actinomycetota bacterium]|nr:glycosyltransferase family 4 protein [Actinomycetota bacterium]
MRLLMVTPYPPLRDGIAAYAVQSVARLRADGVDVEVLSPDPSAAHHHLDLRGRRGPLALARRVRDYDKVVVQFHPDVFFPVPCDSWRFVAVSAGLEAVFRAAHDLEVRVHEADYQSGRGNGVAARAARRMWAAAPRVVVHSDAERQAFCEGFGVPAERVEVVDHGGDFVRYTTADRAEARAALGIPGDEFMFLSIGFIQPHKGFDRAVRAFAGMGEQGCRLDVVGSVRVEEQAYLDYHDELARLADATPGVTMHTRWLSDEEFDRWLVASDVVVLPYRAIWSSSVLERAALYGRPVIVTAVGGLQAQSAGRAVVVEDDDALFSAMWAAAGRRPATPWELPPDASLAEVMTAIRRRAASQRGGTAGTEQTRRDDRVPVLNRPQPASASVAGRLVKSTVRRLTNWQMEPVYRQLDLLRGAIVERDAGRET